MRGLEERRYGGGLRVFVAWSARARLLGLALLCDLPLDCALLLPRCSSVHTFGMRFCLDIVFLDDAGAELSRRVAVPANRFVRHAGAAAVLERRAQDVDEEKPLRLGGAHEPRQPEAERLERQVLGHVEL